jgi:hypothetical protein
LSFLLYHNLLAAQIKHSTTEIQSMMNRPTSSQCLAAVLLAATLFTTSLHADTIPPEDLAEKWAFFGDGSRAAQNRMLYMEESPGSNGVMIFSPESYTGDVTVRYEVMPMNPASICVALLAASEKGKGTSLIFPESGTDSAGPQLNELDAYFFAFHNASHNRKPFVLKFPEGANLIEVEENVVRSGQFHIIEVSRKGTSLSLSIDGNRIFKVEDPEPLEAGHVGFRIRGISQMPAACLIRNVTIESAGAQE